MVDQLYADTLSELEKALAGWNDASVIAHELLRQRDEAKQDFAQADASRIANAEMYERAVTERNDALQLARELRDILEAVLPFIGATDAPEWACGDSYVIIRKADKLLCN